MNPPDGASRDGAKRSVQKILLVDDEESVLFALKLLMQAVGYSVCDFSNPLEALEHLGSGAEIDIVISDLKMPNVNGLKLLTEVRKLRPELPFVLMSAHASPEEQERARALGSSGFLAKPFTPDQLHSMVDAIGLPLAS